MVVVLVVGWVTHSQPTNNIQHPADTHTTATAPLDDDAEILDTEVGSPVLCLVLYTKLSPNLQDVLQGKWVNMWWLFIRHTSSSARYQPNVYTDFLVTVSAQRHSKHINDVGFISFKLQYWIEFQWWTSYFILFHFATTLIITDNQWMYPQSCQQKQWMGWPKPRPFISNMIN